MSRITVTNFLSTEELVKKEKINDVKPFLRDLTLTSKF